jgi:hypothetical protein
MQKPHIRQRYANLYMHIFCMSVNYVELDPSKIDLKQKTLLYKKVTCVINEYSSWIQMTLNMYRFLTLLWAAFEIVTSHESNIGDLYRLLDSEITSFHLLYYCETTNYIFLRYCRTFHQVTADRTCLPGRTKHEHPQCESWYSSRRTRGDTGSITDRDGWPRSK